jgi:hypothetical protein
VDPVPDPLLLRISGSTGNETRTSGSVVRNTDRYTTKAVIYGIRYVNLISYITESHNSVLTTDFTISISKISHFLEDVLWHFAFYPEIPS